MARTILAGRIRCALPARRALAGRHQIIQQRAWLPHKAIKRCRTLLRKPASLLLIEAPQRLRTPLEVARAWRRLGRLCGCCLRPVAACGGCRTLPETCRKWTRALVRSP